MQLTGNTILVTGGASGIGLALGERFLGLGNNVIICGRRDDALQRAKERHPGLHVRQANLSTAADRLKLVEWVTTEYPQLNVLVNNAGIQRHIALPDQEDWETTHEEIAINFEAPVHLSRLLIPHLMKQQNPAIVNVTSGLAFVPMSRAPIYSATKAAMRSFTLTLRHHLRNTPIAVVEIIPPAVQTDLGGPGLHEHGTPLKEFADSVFEQLKTGALETTYGFSAMSRNAGPEEREAIFKRMNQS